MRNSIRTRLTVAFIGLAVGPLLLVGIILAWQSFTTQERQALDLQREVARRVATEITAFFAELENELRLMSKAQMWPGLGRNAPHSILPLLMSQHVFEELVLLDSQGQEKIHLSRLGLSATDRSNHAEADEFVIPHMSDEVYYGPIQFDETSGEPFMTIAVPLLDVRTGLADGVLVSEVRLKRIWDLIAGIRVSPGQSVYIVDAQGRVVAHRNPSVVLRGTSFDVPNQDGIQPGLTGSNVVLAVETARFGEQEFNIVAEQSVSEALALAINTVLITMTLVVVALVMSGTLGFLSVRQIVRPIETLTTTARAISTGDLSQQVEVTSRDEVGQLAATFNRMTAQLRDLFGSLEQRIAERKRAEEALQESEERHRTLFEGVPVGLYRTTPDGQILDANPALVEMLGYPDRESLLAVNAIELYVDPAERAQELALLKREGVVRGFEAQLRRHDGIVIWVQDTARAVRDAEGWALCEGSLEDITERRRLEEQVRQQERLAAVGRLAGGIAHDFNNLLTTIMLYAQMLLRKPHLPPDLAPSVETVLDESRRAAELVRRILDFSRRSIMETRPVDLASPVQESIDILRRTLPENIRLILEVDPEKYVVNADPTRIQQVVMNLALNARDAMPEGGELRIGLSRVEVKPGEEPPAADMECKEWMCLAVSDTGVGMTEEVRQHLFEPFFTTKPVGEGTGLGLAQVYGIVRQHEGYINVETEVEKGTTFRIYLPAHEEEQREEIAEEAAAPLKGKREVILLAEDEESVREVGREMLESLGYQVLTAANGQEALEVYRSAERVDLVLTDLVMPKMGGVELVQELRRVDPHVKALAITGYALATNLGQLKAEIMMNLVQKPLEASTLAQAIRQALDAD